MPLYATDIQKSMEFLERALSDIIYKVVNRLDAEYDNFSIKVYRVGNNVRVDIIPSQKE